MNSPVIVDDIRPLIALLVPWFGMVGIIWAGEKRPNLAPNSLLLLRHLYRQQLCSLWSR